jgi:ferredoxin
VRVEIDASRCDGTGFCAELAPMVFDAEDAPPSRVLVAHVDGDTARDCREAAGMCPTRAVVLHEDATTPATEGEPR